MREFPQMPATADAETTPIRWSVIWLLLGAAFVVILNETTMAVAIPVLMTDLGVDAPTVQWLTTGFMLTMAVIIPMTGYIMNRFTTRQVFFAAMTLFSLGTLLAALSPGFEMLLFSRVVQASGTAIMMPLLMTNILVLVPEGRRGQVMGLVSIVMSMAPALGPTVSGLILHSLNWRWIFWVMLPIALIMLVVGALLMTNVGESSRERLDGLSVVLAALGFGGLVFALNKVGASGGPLVMIVAFVVGVVGLLTFVWRQIVLQREDRPLLDLRTFRYREFTLGLSIVAVGFMAMMGVFLVYPIYLQDVRGLDTLTTGLLMLPGGLAMGLLGPLIGRIYDKVGARPLVIPGSIAMTGFIVLLSVLTTSETPLAVLLVLHVGLSLSLSLVFTPTFTSALNALPRPLYSHGSALVGTLQQVAGAAGTALLVTVMAVRSGSLQAMGVPAVPALLSGTHATFAFAAGLSLIAVVLGFLLARKAPAEEPELEYAGQTH